MEILYCLPGFGLIVGEHVAEGRPPIGGRPLLLEVAWRPIWETTPLFADFRGPIGARQPLRVY